MKIEILKCDRCGKEAITKEEKEELALGDITLGFKQYYYGSSDSPVIYKGHQTWNKQWCRACRTELGILEDEIRKNPDCSVPTLEDMIRNIVHEETQQVQP